MREARNGRRRLLYVLDRFPSDTLNFIYNEIRVLEEAGLDIEIHSLLPAANCPEEARDFLTRTRTLRPIRAGLMLRAWLHYLLRRPLALLTLALRLPLDNDSLGKALRTLSHLGQGVTFAYTVRGQRQHLHAHFASKGALAALVTSRLNGNTYSFTAHGSAVLHAPDRYCLASKVRGAAFIVAVSEFNRQAILRLVPGTEPAKIEVSRTGILLEQFPFVEREDPESGPHRLLCVASLPPVKNHEGLLAACAVLARGGVAFQLDLVGRDQAGRQALLSALAGSLEIDDRVRWLGVVDHGGIAQLLVEAELFVLASRSEGVPLSVMEAMARGTPVLAPRVTGLPELIEDGVSGALADPTQPEEFAAQMEELLADSELRREMAKQARRRIEADYDMRANARNLARLFERRVFSETGGN